jgi:DNA-binding NarL/FixJ family response regulator
MAAGGKIKVMIAEDHEVVRKGLMALIKNNSRKIVVTGDAPNGKELLQLIAADQPDLVILDVEMPVLDGKETLQVLQVKYPNIKTIILSMYYDEAFIAEFIRRGARGYLHKNCSAEKLIETICIVHDNGAYFNEKTSMSLYNRFKATASLKYSDETAGLSPRELEILRLICKGMSSKLIAEKLKISVHTVAFHRVNILKKSRAKSVSALIQFAIRHKLVKM